MTVKELLKMCDYAEDDYVRIYDTVKQEYLTDATIDCVLADGCDFLNGNIIEWSLDLIQIEGQIKPIIDISII